MKTIISLVICSFFFFSAPAQNDKQPPATKKSKKNQNELPNDVFASISYGTVYIDNSVVEHSYENYPQVTIPYYGNSSGTFSIGYNRKVSRVVMIGLVVSYTNCHSTGDYSPVGSHQKYKVHISDDIISEIEMITLNYVNKPVVRLYSAVGVGVTVAFSSVVGGKASTRQMFPAGQVTFLGIRIGRSLGGFIEFGVGSTGMISGGMSYKFGD
jgi:hypothetical protein